MYISCFVIIILEFIEWRERNIDNLTSFNLFQGCLVFILFFHPFWEIVNWTTAIWTIYDSYDIVPLIDYSYDRRDLQCKDGMFYFFVSSPYILIFFGFVLPSSVIMIVPAIIVFIPITCGCCLLFCGCAVTFMFLEDYYYYGFFQSMFNKIEDMIGDRSMGSGFNLVSIYSIMYDGTGYLVFL